MLFGWTGVDLTPYSEWDAHNNEQKIQLTCSTVVVFFIISSYVFLRFKKNDEKMIKKNFFNEKYEKMKK